MICLITGKPGAGMTYSLHKTKRPSVSLTDQSLAQVRQIAIEESRSVEQVLRMLVLEALQAREERNA